MTVQDDDEVRDWVGVAARYEERLTIALAEIERLRAALKAVPQCQFCDGHIHAADALHAHEQKAGK